MHRPLRFSEAMMLGALLSSLNPIPILNTFKRLGVNDHCPGPPAGGVYAAFAFPTVHRFVWPSFSMGAQGA